MKALDTPVLLGILRAERPAGEALSSLQHDELATPEVCLMELEAIARMDRSPGREKRLAAVERLRRRVTVLPLTEKGSRAASTILARRPHALSSNDALVLGIAESHGCSELITSAEFAPPKGAARLTVRVLGTINPKTRK